MSIHCGCNTTLSSANGWLATNTQNGRRYNPQFYAYVFTARGKAMAWCPVCHLDCGNHTYDCPRSLLFNLAFSPALFPTPLHPLHIPYPGSYPPKSHAYSQQDAPNLTTASSLIKKKGSCPFGADCKFTHKCACCQGGHSLSSCHNKPA